jgi:glycerophosphoryl diester phosphodiesterase
MKIIAHRGNTEGSNPFTENHPDIVDRALELGFDVEIDIRYFTADGHLYLGHDSPQYPVTKYWLAERMDKLWIHCKNLEALYYFCSKTSGYNYFWHQDDDFTLTSKQYIWTYPGKSYTASSVIVMPESQMKLDDFSSLLVYNCYGICTDYPKKLKL